MDFFKRYRVLAVSKDILKADMKKTCENIITKLIKVGVVFLLFWTSCPMLVLVVAIIVLFLFRLMPISFSYLYALNCSFCKNVKLPFLV
jgi:hypothetical protein